MSKNLGASSAEETFFTPRPGAKRGLSLVEAAKAAGGIGAGKSHVEPAAIEIGYRIRSARQQRGWTQADLAKRVGIAQGDLSNIERGGGSEGPSYRTLRSIALALSIELPINPIDADTVVVGSEAEDVVLSSARFDTYAPFFSPDDLGAMRDYAAKVADGVGSRDALAAGCTLVQVDGKGGRRRFFSADNYVIVTGLKGQGKYEFHNAKHVAHKRVMCRPLGLLTPESSVTLVPDPGSYMSVMMIGAGAFLDES